MNKIEKDLEKAVGLKKSSGPSSGNIIDAGVVPRETADEKGLTMHPNNPCIISYRNFDSPQAEEYRKLKAVIMRMTKDEFRNTVMVTSAISGEGKSITSANLAVMLARELGQTVLLVDADLRRPSLQRYLGMAPRVGLADCLEDRIDAGRAIVKTGIPKLSFMSAGKKVDNPSELLSSQRMAELLLELKHRYQDRYIILDTAPILLFAETQAMSTLVDGVVIVVKEGGVSLKGIAQMLDVLKIATVLGIVYNNAGSASMDGRYHQHYKHYYRDDNHGSKQKDR